MLLHFHNCPHSRASCRRPLVCFAIPAPANDQQDCSKYHHKRTHDQPRKGVAETPSSTSKSKTRSSSTHEILLVGKDWINIQTAKATCMHSNCNLFFCDRDKRGCITVANHCYFNVFTILGKDQRNANQC